MHRKSADGDIEGLRVRSGLCGRNKGGSSRESKGVEAQLIVKIPPWLLVASANLFWRSTFMDFGVGVSPSPFSFTRAFEYIHRASTYISHYPGRSVCDDLSSSGGSAGRFLLDGFRLLLQSMEILTDSMCAKMSF